MEEWDLTPSRVKDLVVQQKLTIEQLQKEQSGMWDSVIVFKISLTLLGSYLLTVVKPCISLVQRGGNNPPETKSSKPYQSRLVTCDL